ncbi:MAG: DUF5693 family protein [Negativicutes bacterium]|nr:DUF5693 family protein [Negativicutes bacterium]
MTDFRYNRVLLVLIIVGLLASMVIGWQRHAVEENNSRVEMVIDYEDVVELAETEGIAVPFLMQQFKDAGITSLSVYETTLEKLQKSGKLTVLSGADLLARYRSGEVETFPFSDPAGPILPSRIYLFAARSDSGGQTMFAEVKEDLIRRLGPARVHDLVVADNRLGMAVDANYEKALKWNLGLSSQEMREVSGAGFYIVARPTNYVKVRPDDVEALFARLDGFTKVSGIMFVGEEVLGYPDLVPLTASQMQDRGLTLDMIEHPLQLQFLKQDGLLPLAAANGYNAARTYVIPKDEQPKLKVEEAVHRWILTDQERNIRVNLLRKFDKPEPGMNVTETNLKYIEGIKQGLLAKGFTLGRASVYQPYFPSPFLLAVIVVGATAAGVLFLTLVHPFRVRYQYLLLVVLALLLVWPVLKGSGMLVRQVTAMVSAVVFPVLAMTWQLDRWRRREPFRGSSLARILVDGVAGLTATVGLSLVGGLYVAAVLGDVRFILEMEIYRGVKLTFVLPLLLITLTYLVRFNLFDTEPEPGGRSLVKQLLKILDYPVYFKTLFWVALGGLAALILVGRSGHTAGVPVPAIEIKLRAFLEDTMYARPREKEFLIGHPAFLLAVMAMYRQWPRYFHYLLVVVATIGQGSLVETFAHIRTPIYMSLVRGIDGLLLGAVLGVLAAVGVQALHYLSFLLGRRPAADE